MALDRWIQFQKTLADEDTSVGPSSGDVVQNANYGGRWVQSSVVPGGNVGAGRIGSEETADKVKAWFDNIDEHDAFPIDEISNVDDILQRLLNKSIDYETGELLTPRASGESGRKAGRGKSKNATRPRSNSRKSQSRPSSSTSRPTSSATKDPRKVMEKRHLEVKQRAEIRISAEREAREQSLAAKIAASEKHKEELELQRYREDLRRKEDLQKRQKMAQLRREQLTEKRIKSLQSQSKAPVKRFGPNFAKVDRTMSSLQARVQRQKEQEAAVFEIFAHRREITKQVVVRKAFSGWVTHTMQMRITAGKVRGVLVFKREHRLFVGWLRIARQKVAHTEERRFKQDMIQSQKASRTYEERLMARCLKCWRSVVSIEIMKRKLACERESTKYKIDSVLDSLVKPKILSRPSSAAHSRRISGDSASDNLKLDFSQLTDFSEATPNSHPKPKTNQNLEIKPVLKQSTVHTKMGYSQRLMMVQQRRVIAEQKQLISQLQRENSTKTGNSDSSRPSSSVTRVTQRKDQTERSGSGKNSDRSQTFVAKMEERNRLRKDRIMKLKQDREEKAVRAAEDKLKLEEKLKEQEAIAKIQDARERKQRIAEERIKQQQRKEFLAWQREAVKKADEFYDEVLKRRVVHDLRRALVQKRERREMAMRHYNTTVARSAVRCWKGTCDEQVERRYNLYRDYRNRVVLKRCVKVWKDIPYRQEVICQMADRHYNKRLKRKIVYAWTDANEEAQKQHYRDSLRAHEHYKTTLIKRTIKAWRHQRYLEKEEILKQQRMQNMYKRVAEMLPDFSY